MNEAKCYTSSGIFWSNDCDTRFPMDEACNFDLRAIRNIGEKQWGGVQANATYAYIYIRAQAYTDILPHGGGQIFVRT